VFDNSAFWVWPASLGDGPNQYVQFRHDFVLSGAAADAVLRISADSNYALWVNGQFVDYGQYHDYPDRKTYDELTVGHLLAAGANSLCVLTHYQGEGSFQYLKGVPGLAYALSGAGETVTSGCRTRWRVSPCYQQGPIAHVSPQLGLTFSYDASACADDWVSRDFHMGGDWTVIAEEDITPVTERPIIGARPIRKLRMGGRLPVRVVAQGVFHAPETSPAATVAEQMQAVKLSEGGADLPEALPSSGGIVFSAQALHGADGFYLMLDLGREEAGLLDTEVEAEAGTVLDVAWGEHLVDGRVRASLGGRNFASRYVCGEGRQQFRHRFLRLAGRFLQIHISNISDRFVLHYAGLLAVEYPVQQQGSFKSSVDLDNRIYQTSVRTLHLCMHEHYEDCPWREQALYAMDMRNQALCGYYCFGDYDFPAASLDLLGKGLKADGYLELCAPAEIPITIPCFSMAWIMALADLLMYSGGLPAARRHLPEVRKMLGAYQATVTDGLLPCPQGSRYWHFYEWAEGLDGAGERGFDVLERTRFDAPLNLFYCLALQAASLLAGVCGESEEAEDYSAQAARVSSGVHRMFWDGNAGLYRTYSTETLHYAELTQALALVAGVCPPELAPRLRERLAAADGTMVQTTISYSIYKYQALLQDAERYGQHAFDEIRRDWGHMLECGATSFWETIKGEADFGGAGSLCHGWSGIPVYFYHAFVLGIQPTAPGFQTFSHKPLAGIVDSASGCVPTPRGRLQVSVRWQNGSAESSVEWEKADRA